jgi:hypothetical protein
MVQHKFEILAKDKYISDTECKLGNVIREQQQRIQELEATVDVLETKAVQQKSEFDVIIKAKEDEISILKQKYHVQTNQLQHIYHSLERY